MFAAAGAMTSIVLGRLYLIVARRWKVGQTERDDGPEAHRTKAGTPTMGGLVFWLIAAVTGLVLVLPVHANKRLLVAGVVIGTLGLGLIGLLDDLAKVLSRQTTGIPARWRIVAQAAVAAATVGFLDHAWPFIGPPPDFRWLGFGGLSDPVRYLLDIAVIVGAANAVNFTDGIDGLAAGTCGLALLAFSTVALCLGLHLWPPATALAIFLAVMGGVSLGFLVWNWHPARLFMGDVGSMTLGGLLGAAAVALHVEIFLVVLGGIFVVETLSVIGQVISFQLTGKRILKMAPLHHHFELSGWSEGAISLIAYLVQMGLAGAALVLMWYVQGGPQ
ncbi:MAG: phospho-N-acetylmuramoyl-pentapeptide-transferase [Armatimonadetes bacterium]|nr:phospho-N-acetylmuramoyl-pentapeptide-transferase [Armatimonadota bacterium]